MNEEKLHPMHEIINRSDAKRLGLKRYFTGEPCHAGHIAERLVSNYCCWECSKAKYAAYRAANIEHERERYRIYYHNDPVKARAGRDKAKEKIAHRAWFLANKRKAYAKHKKWREKNPDIMERNRCRHREKSPETYRCYVAKRRAKVTGAGGSFNKLDIQNILTMQRWRCAEPTCAKSLRSGYHMDHIMPIALGGDNWPRNIQCLCRQCNLRKHAKHPLEWARENGRFL